MALKQQLRQTYKLFEKNHQPEHEKTMFFHRPQIFPTNTELSESCATRSYQFLSDCVLFHSNKFNALGWNETTSAREKRKQPKQRGFTYV